ncbi:DWNN domain-containing protein [Sarocladium implicatum]|nr:DWNN domain-containing protein [Sarocladium implicatum]
MASSVFFKFKSQKEPTRVEFDGTGISVFELKREIITKSGLGDGTDLDLCIYTDDGNEEYDDDTTIIPRSTTVIARRFPASKPGAGRAARYVSGKAPVSAKNAGRREQSSKATTSKASSNGMTQMNAAMTEEEKMAAMFAAQSEQWSAQQEEMSHQTPVLKPGTKRPPANVPDREPPNGYICFRCGQKGHWIQLCPTNDDPEFDNRPRMKRTTGIPRSFLQKVDKSVVLAQTDGDETKRPSGVMVNADGDYVIAEPDKASWEQFQAKTKTSSEAKEAEASDDKEAQERGLACPIDKKLLIEPMKTPCCEKSFCNDCITNALIESDFVCPACQTESVLIDDLQPDSEVAKKIQEFVKEKETVKTPPVSPKAEKSEESTQDNTGENAAQAAESAAASDDKDAAKDSPKAEVASPSKAASPKSPNGTTAEGKAASPETSDTETKATEAKKDDTTSDHPQTEDAQSADTKADESKTKKRPADDFLENPKIPKGPRAMQQQQQHQNQMPNMMNGMNGMNGMPNMGMPNMMFNGMPMMPNMMGMPGMPGMGMPNMMNMPMMGMPNMNMGGFNGMNGNGWDMSGMNHNMGMNGGMMNNNMNNHQQQHGGNFPMRNNFSQQQQDEDAYFRKPVNPHRHQNKGRRARPSDYREL